jgi:FdrA protein
MNNIIDTKIPDPIVVVNLGLENFAENLESQGVEVIRVDWRPPAGGDQEMIALLDQLL